MRERGLSVAPPRGAPSLTRGEVASYSIPTTQPESDGTFVWDKTTLVLVHLYAGDAVGLGYTYANGATAELARQIIREVLAGRDVFDIPAAWKAMRAAVRNMGQGGISAMAISAIDCALWDLKARLLQVPLVRLLGASRESIPVYGSGGFTSYTPEELQEQLGGWAAEGIGMVKMKIGREPQNDLERVRLAREAIGKKVKLFVDANGAYSRKQALRFAELFAVLDVRWFEEPVPSHDLEGLRLLRDRAPANMDIAAGEYGYDDVYFRRMVETGAVDVLQADCTRCCGLTGFLQADALCHAANLPLSAHCAPAQHVAVCCAAQQACHLEYFHDHARIERMLFDGAITPVAGELHPDLSRPGMGLEFKRADAERYAA